MNLRDKLKENIERRDEKLRAAQEKELNAAKVRMAQARIAREKFLEEVKSSMTRLILVGEVPEYRINDSDISSWIERCTDYMNVEDDQDLWEATVNYFEVQGIRLVLEKKNAFVIGGRPYLTVTPLDKAT